MQIIKSIKRSKGIIITKSKIVVNILKERQDRVQETYGVYIFFSGVYFVSQLSVD